MLFCRRKATLSTVAPLAGAWIEIAAHTAPRRTRPSPLRPVCPPGAPSCRPEKSSFVPSVVMYPVSFQLFVSPKNSFADFTWPFFSVSTGAFSENCGLTFSPSVSIPVSEGLGEVTSECVSAEKEVLLVTFFFLHQEGRTNTISHLHHCGLRASRRRQYSGLWLFLRSK